MSDMTAVFQTWEINRDQRVALYRDGVFFVETIIRTPEGKRFTVEQITVDEADSRFPGARGWWEQLLRR
jgi:hypothetical protein